MKQNSSKNPETILFHQLHDFIEILQGANKKRQIPRPYADYTYIENFFHRVIEDRNNRGDEIDSKEFAKAIEIANRLLPYPTYLENCMDGRLFGPLIGLYGHIGDVLSVAGGILYEFVRDENQNMYIIPNSNFGFMLRDDLKPYNVTGIVEIIDSHVGCAAREAEEIARGRYPKDHGLLTDVIQKLEMCEAMKAYAQILFQGKKDVFPINISTDPKDGFMYMGLATPNAIQYAQAHDGFTQEVLNYLAEKEYVISTKQLAQDPRIEKELQVHTFPIDLTNNYAEAAVQVWKHTEQMKETLLPVIIGKLKKVYPGMGNDPKRQKELLERAIILLVNTFTGFLHKKYYSSYPYAEHHEEGVLVAKGNNPPYKIALFAESSLDMNNLPSNIDLAASIVRSNRKTGRVLDSSGIFSNAEAFVSSPVCVLLQVKVLDVLSEEEWKKLCTIDWSDIRDISWETMDDATFLNYLEDKAGTIPLCVVTAINKLRKRVAILFDMDEVLASRLIDHDIIVLPIISDVSKRVRFIIPFLKTGFS